MFRLEWSKARNDARMWDRQAELKQVTGYLKIELEESIVIRTKLSVCRRLKRKRYTRTGNAAVAVRLFFLVQHSLTYSNPPVSPHHFRLKLSWRMLSKGKKLYLGMDMEWPIDRTSSIQGQVAVISEITYEKNAFLLQVKSSDMDWNLGWEAKNGDTTPSKNVSRSGEVGFLEALDIISRASLSQVSLQPVRHHGPLFLKSGITSLLGIFFIIRDNAKNIGIERSIVTSIRIVAK